MADISKSSKLRILVIDDNADLCEIFVDYLEGQGHSVCTRNCGNRFADLLNEIQYDVVICDLTMPRFNIKSELEAFKALKNPPRLILMTGDAERARGIDIDAPILTKPFSLADVKDLLIKPK